MRLWQGASNSEKLLVIFLSSDSCKFAPEECDRKWSELTPYGNLLNQLRLTDNLLHQVLLLLLLLLLLLIDAGELLVWQVMRCERGRFSAGLDSLTCSFGPPPPAWGMEATHVSLGQEFLPLPFALTHTHTHTHTHSHTHVICHGKRKSRELVIKESHKLHLQIPGPLWHWQLISSVPRRVVVVVMVVVVVVEEGRK